MKVKNISYVVAFTLMFNAAYVYAGKGKEHLDRINQHRRLQEKWKYVESKKKNSLSGSEGFNFRLDSPAHLLVMTLLLANVFEEAIAKPPVNSGPKHKEAKAFQEEQCPTLPDVIQVSPKEFLNSTASQETLFEKSKILRDQMMDFCGRMPVVGNQNILPSSYISQTAASKCVSVLKRDNSEQFVRGVLEKCNRRGYKVISSMGDIVRGRLNLDSMEEVKLAVQTIQDMAPQYGMIVDSISGPRRPIQSTSSQELFGYPRYHVNLRDRDGLAFEWQIGTAGVTDVFERTGIPIPKELTLPSGIRNDLHDIEYDVFQPIVKMAEQDPGLIENRDLVTRIRTFSHELDEIAARAGLLTDYAELDQQIRMKHKEAGELLEDLVRLPGGVEMILHRFH
jgi:hypothetical protein